MKKIYSIAFIFIAFLSFSQDRDSYMVPTSLEEYNYLSKGYKIQIESGLDMKKGYVLKDVGGNFFQNMSVFGKLQKREVEFKLLFRENEIHENRACAILMILSRKETNFKEYFCIPSLNNELWKNFEKDFYSSICKIEGMNEAEASRLVAASTYFYNSLKMISYMIYYPEKLTNK